MCRLIGKMIFYPEQDILIHLLYSVIRNQYLLIIILKQLNFYFVLDTMSRTALLDEHTGIQKDGEYSLFHSPVTE